MIMIRFKFCYVLLRFIEPSIFTNLRNLRLLDISKNRIIVLTPENFVHLPNLQILDLRQNPIMCISPNAFSRLSMLQQLLVSISLKHYYNLLFS